MANEDRASHIGDGTGAAGTSAWCGAPDGIMEWRFVDATHALLALRNGTAITPCPACLRAIRLVIDAELATDPPDRDPALPIPQRP